MIRVGLSAAAALAMVVGGAAVAGQAEKEKSGAAACFEQLKKLAGEWVSKGADGNETLALKFRVTAGGSAVEEVFFPGLPHEMVSIYHMDGKDLVMTHYCAVGNQPRFKATASSTPKKIVFECTGVGNAKSHDDMHIHGGVIEPQGSDKLVAVWSGFVDGKLAHEAKFEATRKK
jgi:hypothetical protein